MDDIQHEIDASDGLTSRYADEPAFVVDENKLCLRLLHRAWEGWRTDRRHRPCEGALPRLP